MATAPLGPLIVNAIRNTIVQSTSDNSAEAAIDKIVIENLEETPKLTGVSERQRPQTKVGRRVRDTTQRELDRVDRLVDHDVTEVELQ